MRAYDGMRLSGGDISAFEVAVTVLSLRHPGHSKGDYRQTVSAWLSHEEDLKDHLKNKNLKIDG